MRLYFLLKHLHVACVVLSGAGFALRGIWMVQGSPLLSRRWVRWAPHLVDTVLLASAIAMAVLSDQYPFREGWLTAKVWGLLGYIVLGRIALKGPGPQPVRVVAWVGALSVFAYIVSVAILKQPLGWIVLF